MSHPAEKSSIQQVLTDWEACPEDPQTRDRLVVSVYAELRHLAAARLRHEAHTLSSPTDLVHEVWLKLDRCGFRGSSRSEFFKIASLAMRNVLVDRARARSAQKRSAGAEHLSLRWAQGEAVFSDPGLLDLDAALQKLRCDHPRHADVVQLRCFGGLELAEIAQTLGIGLSTVKRDWLFANAWLVDAMKGPA